MPRSPTDAAITDADRNQFVMINTISIQVGSLSYNAHNVWFAALFDRQLTY